MSKIALVTASLRTPRVGPHIASWVNEVLSSRPKDALTIEPIAIADFKLPVFDETVVPAAVPAHGEFQHDHSKKWSAAMAPFAGYVFVVPEYNFSIPGGVKNAVDYLYNEWIGKPVVVITYGVQGGKQSSAHLSGVLEGMKLKVMEAKPQLPFAGGQGPDAFAAMGGNLGEDSKKAWSEDGLDKEVLKAWGQLKEVVESTTGQAIAEQK